MKSLPLEATLIDVSAIRPFIRRSRKREAFDGVVESIRKDGLKVPIEVRDITDEPAAERRRPDGGLYKYELVKGEGRTLAHQEIGLPKILAYVVKAKQAEIVGRFLNENIGRRSLLWSEKARLVKDEVEAGASLEEVAKRYTITLDYARKLIRVLQKTAHGLESEVAAMGMNDAEVLTTLPAEHQTIVVEMLRENPERQVKDIVRRVEAASESGRPLSAMAVRQSLKRVDEDLAKLRQSLKVTRLHHSLGPQNIVTLLRGKRFRAALEKAGVNLERFESLADAN